MENKHMFETTNQYINIYIYIISNFFGWSNPHLLLIQAPWSHYSATAIWRLGSWIPPRSNARNPQEPPDVKMSLWYDVVRLWWSLHHRKWMWMIYIYVNMYNHISIIIHIIPYIYIYHNPTNHWLLPLTFVIPVGLMLYYNIVTMIFSLNFNIQHSHDCFWCTQSQLHVLRFWSYPQNIRHQKPRDFIFQPQGPNKALKHTETIKIHQAHEVHEGISWH